MKIIITESQYKFLVEQPSPTSDGEVIPTTTEPPKQQMGSTPEQRAAAKERNRLRLAPIEAGQKMKIQNWIDSNSKPGSAPLTTADYWKWQEKRNKGNDADPYGGQLNTSSANKRGETKGSCNADGSAGDTKKGESLKDIK
jgi:hypothetical protein